MKELEKYFLLDEFEDGWGMDDEFICEEQLFDYCVEVLFIPDEKIDELNLTFIKVKGHKKNSLKDEIDTIFNLVDKASRSALRENMLT